MEIKNIAEFLDYYDRVKERSLKVISCIPDDKIDWTYREGKFTIGDLVRHLALSERFLFAEAILSDACLYKGCGAEYAGTKDEIIALYKTLNEECRKIFLDLSEEKLKAKCTTPAGIKIGIGKWLRAMLEHEIHHRAQLYTYLGILQVKTPPIFGLTSEEVIQKSK